MLKRLINRSGLLRLSLKVLLLVGIMLMMLPQLTDFNIGALTYATVTIKFTPSPSGMAFTVHYVSDRKVGLTWGGLPADVDKVMIRAKYGSYPADITDGYLVYEGALSNVDDLMVVLDDTVEVYYNLYPHYISTGIYDTVPLQGKTRGVGMILLALVVLCLALMGGAYFTKSWELSAAAFIAWLILGVWAYTTSSEALDLYNLLFWLSIPMMLLSIFGTWSSYSHAHPKKIVNEYGESDEPIKMSRTIGQRMRAKGYSIPKRGYKEQ